MTSRDLSLCLLVDHTTPELTPWLQTVDGLFDELIVVNMGCPAAHLEGLRGLDASIVYVPDTTDRAGAYQAATAQAQGRWILVLEPHEYISPALKTAIQTCVQQNQTSAASIQIQATDPQQGLVSHQAVRLFRADPSIVFVHPICADPTLSILTLLRQQNQALHKLDGNAIVRWHDTTAQTRYQEDRLQKLYAHTDAEPTDLQAWNMLLQIGHMTHDQDLLLTTAQRLEALITPETVAHFANSDWIGELLVSVADALYPQDREAMRAYLIFWEGHLDNQAALYLKLGEMFEAESDWAHAQAAFMRCMELRTHTPNIQLTTVRPLLALARLALAQQDNATALELLNLAITADPKDSEALFGLTSLGQQLGGQDALAAIVRAYTETYGETAEMQTALAETALQVGDMQNAIVYLEHAETMLPNGRAEQLLRQVRENQDIHA